MNELIGAVVKQGNLEEMFSKILEFKNTGFKQLYSSDCRKRAEECFEKYIELYEGLLK